MPVDDDKDGGDNNNNDYVYEALKIEYKDMASWYDSFWKSYTDGTLKRPLDEVLKQMNTRDGTKFSLLDAGCGTGSLLRRLLDVVLYKFASIDDRDCEDTLQLQLTGIEPSKEMLEQAHKKFANEEESTSTTTIILNQSPAEQLTLDDESQDMVVSTNAFHFFRDKERSLQEMKRVLKQNGTIIIADWCNDYWLVKLYHLLERIRWNWRFKDKYPGPLSSSKLIDLFNTAGFCNIEHSVYRVRVFSIFFWGMQTIKATKSDDQTMWECEVCNMVSFEDYDDALAHEKECIGITNHDDLPKQSPLIQ